MINVADAFVMKDDGAMRTSNDAFVGRRNHVIEILATLANALLSQLAVPLVRQNLTNEQKVERLKKESEKESTNANVCSVLPRPI